jgi:hypothetical protein
MADNRIVRAVLVAVAAVAVAVAAAGCGVSSTSPQKIGNAIAAGTNPRNVDPPPGPDDQQLPRDLVTNFFKAGVESGSTSTVQRIASFLTPQFAATFGNSFDAKNVPPPLVIRLLGTPVDGPFDQSRTPVDVRYEVLGQLTAQGRVDSLADPNQGTMRFWVKTSDTVRGQRNRIDQIDSRPPGGTIMISDEALEKYYDIQPVYFWDAAASKLVPDIRYVPSGLDPAVRANRIVQWLCSDPSPWLPEVQRLPSQAALKSPVVPKDDRLEVNLTAPAGGGGPPAIQRLYQQLQWSLQSTQDTPKIDLFIDDKLQTNLGGIDDYRPANLSYTLPSPPRRYDIVDGKVVQLDVGTPPPLLTTKENAQVVFAGVNRSGSALAVVRTQGNLRRLQVVRADGTAVTPALTPTADMGRPVWAGNGVLLIPAGGKLYSVTMGGDVEQVLKNWSGNIRQVAISPDGRRVALVADGQVWVTSLNVSDTIATIGTNNQRPILAGQVDAVAVAWTSEGWMYVAGKNASLWKVTADSVIATDLSSSLGPVIPEDLVAYPTSPFSPSYVTADVLLFAKQTVYRVLPTLSQDTTLHAPFFGL